MINDSIVESYISPFIVGQIDSSIYYDYQPDIDIFRENREDG